MGDDERLRSIHALTYICLIHTLILMRTTVRLPAELLEHAKRKAAAEGKTLTALIEDGLRLVISPARTIEPKRSSSRDRLPLSKCSGGLLPGVDPIRFASELEEAEDIERLQRTRRRR
jgi:hypothetical protein